MFEINNYIGKHCVIHQISLKDNNGKDLLLFRLIDVVEEEMQDYTTCREDSIEGVGVQDDDMLLLETKQATLTVNLLSHMGDEVKSVLLPLHLERDVDELKKLLPKRQTASYVRLFQKDTLEAKAIVEKDEKLTSSLKELTEKHFGYDFECFKKYIGNTILVCYNPIYRSINLKEDGKKPGLYFRVNYWKGHREQLFVEITSKDKNGVELMRKTFKTAESVFLSHFDLEREFHKLDIEVKSLEGTLIDYYKDVTFIRSIEVKLTANG